MSDREVDIEQPIYAELIRGRYYDYNGKVWEVPEDALEGDRGPTLQITVEEFDWMLDHANDRKTVDDQLELIPKFRYSNTAPEAPKVVEAPKPRVRRRRAAA